MTDRYQHCPEEDDRHRQVHEDAWGEVIAIEPSTEGRPSRIKTEVFTMRGSGHGYIILTTGLSDPKGLVRRPFTSLGMRLRNAAPPRTAPTLR